MPGRQRQKRRPEEESAAAKGARKRKGADGCGKREEGEADPEMSDEGEVFSDEELGDAELGEVVDCGEYDADMGDEEEDEEEEPMDEDGPRRRAFRPGIDEMPEDHELQPDQTAYDMFHKLKTQWPCLSFDVIQDRHGASRTRFPLQCYWVMGSQSEDIESNYVAVMKASKMHKTKNDGKDEYDDDEEDEDPDEEDDDEDMGEEHDPDEDAVLEQKARPHTGCVNRVRAMPQRSTIVAAWGEEGYVSVFDFTDSFRQLDDVRGWVRDNAAKGGVLAGKHAPLVFQTPQGDQGHKTEGFALDWSRMEESTLATGDLEGQLWCWKVGQDGTVQKVNLTATRPAPGAVEDVRWSPTQPTVLLTGNGGGTCQVYDCRDPSGAKVTWEATSGCDVNVLDWNVHRGASHLIATGADDGGIKIWDLRTVQRNSPVPVQSYDFHRSAITSLEWSPTNESMLAVASDDNQVTLWDFSIERDAEEEVALAAQHPELASYPAQLVFQHCGLSEPKEVHWHPQLPGVVLVADLNGMDIFRPSNWKSLIR